MSCTSSPAVRLRCSCLSHKAFRTVTYFDYALGKMATATGNSKGNALSKADYLKRYLSGNGDSKKSKEKRIKKKRTQQLGTGCGKDKHIQLALLVSLATVIESISIHAILLVSCVCSLAELSFLLTDCYSTASLKLLYFSCCIAAAKCTDYLACL